jgi:hypothetical protein
MLGVEIVQTPNKNAHGSTADAEAMEAGIARCGKVSA